MQIHTLHAWNSMVAKQNIMCYVVAMHKTFIFFVEGNIKPYTDYQYNIS